MGSLFIIVSHAVTVGGILALFIGGYHAVVDVASIHERVARAMAITTGAFAYLAAKALGLSIPTLLLESIEGGKWFSLVSIGVLFPSMAGFFLARYIMRCMKRHDAIALRAMLLVASLVLIMFADVYVVAAGQAKLDTLQPLLPNLTFLLTMMGYIVFEYNPQNP